MINDKSSGYGWGNGLMYEKGNKGVFFKQCTSEQIRMFHLSLIRLTSISTGGNILRPEPFDPASIGMWIGNNS